MPRSRAIAALLLVAPCACATALADADVDAKAIERCVQIRDDRERLACYDQLAGRAAQDKASPPASAAHPEPERQATNSAGLKPNAVNVDCEQRSTPLSCHWELDQAAKRGTFRLLPHKQNYFLPVRWSSSPNEQPVSPTQGPAPREPLDNIESKFQISLKTKLAQNLFDGRADLWFAYTQQSFWQVYNGPQSRPFRETDYEPEAMLVFPIDYRLGDWRARFLNLGFVHQSNGSSDPLSRSWNRVYAQVALEHDNAAVLVRGWYRLPESASNDNNPDIEHYLGYGDLLAIYKFDTRHTVSLLVRNNLSTSSNKGSLQLDWSFPLIGDLKFYAQVFTGYGESLLDYNWRQTTIGIGVLLTDWM
jgi:phospholipase A1